MSKIIGAGGGGKGGGGSSHTPTESPDTLRSKQFARVLDLVSEGEIEGLVNADKSIYLDGTPLQNNDDTYNFSGFTWSSRNGTQAQSYIPGAPSVENTSIVNVEVKNSAPVTRQFTNQNIDYIRITILVPSLSYQNPSNGDLGGTSVQIAIDLQSNGGGFVEQINDTISGKTTSKYQRSYLVKLTGSSPWDIRIRRLTEDSIQTNLQNKTILDTQTEIIDSKLSYPNSAIVAVSVDASQFSSIPTRSYDLKLLRVQVPTNYDPVTRAYSGAWDGTFKIAWTDNPAWCFYDLLTSERYGLGAFIDSAQVDKWVLYTIAQYCDTLVQDGFGGTEPRFTCNLYLQTRAEAYKVINDMASIFRSMVYWASGAITAVQDAPADACYIYTPANVIDGEFNYSGASAKQKHTVALVTWSDPSDFYRQKVEYVEDANGIEQYGVISTDIVALGCTSRGQAHRLGKWLLYSERLESEVITFKVGLDGAIAAPGQIIKVSDPVRAGVRFGGRIVSATTTEITLDNPVTLESGQQYKLSLFGSDAAIVEATVTNVAGSATVLNVSPPLAAAPVAMSVWILSCEQVEAQLFRVVGVSESDTHQYEITCLKHNASKFNAIEQDIVLQESSISILNSTPSPVSDLVVTESLYLISTVLVGTKATVSWYGISPKYILQYRKAGENPVSITTTSSSYEVTGLLPGQYEFSVSAVNALGTSSTKVTKNIEIYGKLSLPNDVSNIALSAIGGMAYLTWNAATDLDVLVGGSLKVRYTPDKATPDWNNAVDIGQSMPGTSTSATLPLLSGSYMTKWIDSSGNASANANYVSTDAADILNLNVVETVTESPTFSGAKTNMVLDTALGGLKLDSTINVDGMGGNVDDWGNVDAIGGIASSGSYAFSSTLDLGSIYTSRLTMSLSAQCYDADGFVDKQTQNIDLWLSVDGTLIDNVLATLMVRTTNDDPSASPVWSAWQSFFLGDWTARAFQFRLDVTNQSITNNILVTALSVTVDMPDRAEQGNDIASGAGTYSVTYVLPFKSAPNIGVTAQNMSTGDYYIVSNKTQNGFDILFKNSGGSAVSRTFDWQARGY